MKQPVVIIGIGEMGGVFARGFLKAGYPVYPLGRDDDIEQMASQIAQPALVLLAVAEKDYPDAVRQVPASWQPVLALLQNELLPRDWQQAGIDNPTVISVWFEKKPGQDFKVLVPSPVFGPQADIIEQGLAGLGIPVAKLDDEQQLLFELVRKNLYILTTNICGLETGGTVSELWNDHALLMNRVFDDMLDIQQHLSGQNFNRDRLLSSLLTAFDGDPDHKCMGRSAPARLQRALQIAKDGGIQVAELERIQQVQD